MMFGSPHARASPESASSGTSSHGSVGFMNLCRTPDSTSTNGTHGNVDDGRRTREDLSSLPSERTMQYAKYIPHAPRDKVNAFVAAVCTEGASPRTASCDSPKPRRETHCGMTMVNHTSIDEVCLNERLRSHTFTSGCAVGTGKDKVFRTAVSSRNHLRGRPDTIQHHGRRFRFVTCSMRHKNSERLDSTTSQGESTDSEKFTSVESADGDIFYSDQGGYVPSPPNRAPKDNKSELNSMGRDRIVNQSHIKSLIDDCDTPPVHRENKTQPPIIDITAPSPSNSSHHSSIIHPRKGLLSLRYISVDSGQSSGTSSSGTLSPCSRHCQSSFSTSSGDSGASPLPPLRKVLHLKRRNNLLPPISRGDSTNYENVISASFNPMNTPSPLSSPEVGLWGHSDIEFGRKASVSPLALPHSGTSSNRSPFDNLEFQGRASLRSQRSTALVYNGLDNAVESDTDVIWSYLRNGFSTERSDDSAGEPAVPAAHKSSPQQSPRKKSQKPRAPRTSPKGSGDRQGAKYAGKGSNCSTPSSSGSKTEPTQPEGSSSVYSGSGTASSLDVAPPSPDDGDPNVSLPDIQGKQVLLEHDRPDRSVRISSATHERRTSSSRRTSGGRKVSRSASSAGEKLRRRKLSKSKQPSFEIDVNDSPHRKLSASKVMGNKGNRRISATKVAPESEPQNSTHAYKDSKTYPSAGRQHSEQSPTHGRKTATASSTEEASVKTGRHRRFFIKRTK